MSQTNSYGATPSSLVGKTAGDLHYSVSLINGGYKIILKYEYIVVCYDVFTHI